MRGEQNKLVDAAVRSAYHTFERFETVGCEVEDIVMCMLEGNMHVLKDYQGKLFGPVKIKVGFQMHVQ